MSMSIRPFLSAGLHYIFILSQIYQIKQISFFCSQIKRIFSLVKNYQYYPKTIACKLNLQAIIR